MRNEHSALKVVRIGRSLDRDIVEAVGRRLHRTLREIIAQVEIVQYEPPAVDRIEACLLSQVLDHEVGGHILGIADMDLQDTSGTEFFKFLFGYKDKRNSVAVVSTRRLESPEPRRFLARLMKVALHEIGHNFGLVHHYSFKPTRTNDYCPMSKGTYNRHGERSYVRSVIDSRGLEFCGDCRSFLRRVHGVG